MGAFFTFLVEGFSSSLVEVFFTFLVEGFSSSLVDCFVSSGLIVSLGEIFPGVLPASLCLLGVLLYEGLDAELGS